MTNIKTNQTKRFRQKVLSKDLIDFCLSEKANLLDEMLKKQFSIDFISSLYDSIKYYYDWDNLKHYAEVIYNSVPSSQELAKNCAKRCLIEIEMN